jgi:hypothetical protein
MHRSIAEVLSPITASLQADGYSVDVIEGADVLEVKIIAGDGICADCLSPRSIIEPMVNHLLQDAGITRKLILVYPESHPSALKDGART